MKVLPPCCNTTVIFFTNSRDNESISKQNQFLKYNCHHLCHVPSLHKSIPEHRYSLYQSGGLTISSQPWFTCTVVAWIEQQKKQHRHEGPWLPFPDLRILFQTINQFRFVGWRQVLRCGRSTKGPSVTARKPKVDFGHAWVTFG